MSNAPPAVELSDASSWAVGGKNVIPSCSFIQHVGIYNSTDKFTAEDLFIIVLISSTCWAREYELKL
jgi:hypothetical protein